MRQERVYMELRKYDHERDFDKKKALDDIGSICVDTSEYI